MEAAAAAPVASVALLPFVHRHIAVMPDVHVGKGTTVGCVIPTLRAIIRRGRVGCAPSLTTLPA